MHSANSCSSTGEVLKQVPTAAEAASSKTGVNSPNGPHPHVSWRQVGLPHSPSTGRPVLWRLRIAPGQHGSWALTYRTGNRQYCDTQWVP
ncbi:hypothetical protein AGIG_G12436 [Arapaima gigas]